MRIELTKEELELIEHSYLLEKRIIFNGNLFKPFSIIRHKDHGLCLLVFRVFEDGVFDQTLLPIGNIDSTKGLKML